MMKIAPDAGRQTRYSYAKCGFSPVQGNVVSVFDAYFDESGTHSNKLLVIAGYTAETDKWAVFSAKWNALLEKLGLTYFHMTSFMSNSGKVYSRLSGLEKVDLLSGLLGLISETALFGSFSIISPYHYNRLTTPQFRSNFGTAYACCGARLAALAVGKVQEILPGNNRVGIFFEDGHKNVMQTLDLIRHHKKGLEEIDSTGIDKIEIAVNDRYNSSADPFRKHTAKVGAIGVGTKIGMPPLQAADILAYCVYSSLTGQYLRFCNKTMDRLDESVEHFYEHLSPEYLKELVAATIDAEENHRRYKMGAYLLSKETRREGVHVITDEFGRTSMRSMTHKPISPELTKLFDEFMRDKKWKELG